MRDKKDEARGRERARNADKDSAKEPGKERPTAVAVTAPASRERERERYYQCPPFGMVAPLKVQMRDVSGIALCILEQYHSSMAQFGRLGPSTVGMQGQRASAFEEACTSPKGFSPATAQRARLLCAPEYSPSDSCGPGLQRCH